MKWDHIKLLQEQYANLVRHDYGRKCTEWHQAEDEVTIPTALADLLGCYVIPPGNGPMDDLHPDFAGGIFTAILIETGELFLVNTEGYDYCRYIARCVVS